MGERVLLDLRADLPKRWRQGDPAAIEVQIGGSGQVHVPRGSSVKVYAGRLTLRLRAGGDVTLVTEHEVVPQGPEGVIGRVEKPAA